MFQSATNRKAAILDFVVKLSEKSSTLSFRVLSSIGFPDDDFNLDNLDFKMVMLAPLLVLSCVGSFANLLLSK